MDYELDDERDSAYGLADRRRSIAGATYRAAYMLYRPTEDSVGRERYDGLPASTVAERKPLRYCLKCKVWREPQHFTPDSRFPLGLSFFCSDCRRKHKRPSWRDYVKE